MIGCRWARLGAGGHCAVDMTLLCGIGQTMEGLSVLSELALEVLSEVELALCTICDVT